MDNWSLPASFSPCVCARSLFLHRYRRTNWSRQSRNDGKNRSKQNVIADLESNVLRESQEPKCVTLGATDFRFVRTHCYMELRNNSAEEIEILPKSEYCSVMIRCCCNRLQMQRNKFVYTLEWHAFV